MRKKTHTSRCRKVFLKIREERRQYRLALARIHAVASTSVPHYREDTRCDDVAELAYAAMFPNGGGPRG